MTPSEWKQFLRAKENAEKHLEKLLNSPRDDCPQCVERAQLRVASYQKHYETYLKEYPNGSG